MNNAPTTHTPTTGTKESKRLLRAFSQALSRYPLIKDADHILVGLSGGKDSLVLTHLLAQRMHITRPHFRLTALHIAAPSVGYHTDVDYLSDFCRNLGVEFVVKTVESTQSSIHQDKNICFSCSRMRRKLLFEEAERLSCNKIALGHQQDDIIETLLMNMIFHGVYASVPPVLQLDSLPYSIIRPLYMARESDVESFANMIGVRTSVKECPHKDNSRRADAKRLIAEFERLNPNARSSIMHAMTHIDTKYLPHV